MYDDIIKRLRNRRICIQQLGTLNDYPLLGEAADAIEKLSKPKWIKFAVRELTADEKEDHPDGCYIMDCEKPDDNEEILVSNGKRVSTDTYCVDGDECYLDSGWDLEDCWWMPLPEPPKEAT